ncbi:MAG: D-alanyl-D-alanine carboxypeptidase/D-alanyl-D-alanine-endopeptidase [Pyrinomonadaceae bacterium]
MIKKSLGSRSICLLLLFALSLSMFASGSAQEQQRQRRVIAPVTSAAPATASAAAPKTVEELRARIQEVLRSGELAPVMVAVKVASLDTGRTLYEENADKLLRPASNMKIFTVAAALDRLSPDYRFTTSVYAPARPDATGTVRGDLIVYGRGDPSIAARFNNGDYNRAIDDLAARIAAAGVKRVEGDLVGDESYFTGAPFGLGWTWDDLTWYFGAEVSALSVNDNALDLFVRPGASVGAPCVVTTGPPTPLASIINRTTTVASGMKRDVSIYRSLGENVIEVGGQLPFDDTGYTASVAISRPALVFVYMLRASLAQKGVTITGKSRTVDARERRGVPLQTSSLTEVASLQSPPLGVIAAQTLKPSQNLYAELILRALGKAAPGDAARTSDEAGVEAVKAFLRTAGINADGLVIADGSGLSRRDLITADATIRLLAYMSKHRYANAFRDALPIAGVDGSLSRRMKGTAAANNLRAKTGSINGVATLSGYVTSAGGERLAFSIMLNNYAEGLDSRRSYIDIIAVLLASYAGRS